MSLCFGVQFDLPGFDRGGRVVEAQVEARLSGRSGVDFDAVPGAGFGGADQRFGKFHLHAVGFGRLPAEVELGVRADENRRGIQVRNLRVTALVARFGVDGQAVGGVVILEPVGEVQRVNRIGQRVRYLG